MQATLQPAPHIDDITDLHVVEATTDSGPWNRFVDSDPSSTFAHQSGWRHIMADVLGHDTQYLAAVDDAGTWTGVLPLVRVRSPLGHYLMSLPFLNDGGPLGSRIAQRTLVDHAVSEAQSSGAKMLELRSRSHLPDSITPSHRKISVHLNLPSTVEELWRDTFRAKLRSQIRRPMKEGMSSKSGLSELDAFYRVFSRNMRDLGTPVLPRRFFEQIAATFGPRVVFTVVYTAGGDPAAAACSLIWRKEMEVTWASSIRELNRLSPNMLLYSSLMEDAIRNGVTLFNFGRCTPDGSTHRFKLQWGSHDVQLPWGSWTRTADASVPSPHRPVFRAATAAWRRLPLPIANRLGPQLARMLP